MFIVHDYKKYLVGFYFINVNLSQAKCISHVNDFSSIKIIQKTYDKKGVLDENAFYCHPQRTNCALYVCMQISSLTTWRLHHPLCSAFIGAGSIHLVMFCYCR